MTQPQLSGLAARAEQAGLALITAGVGFVAAIIVSAV
jgi:hypothetical protein